MNWTLEVVVVPVSDVDRGKAFNAEQLGFNVDHDTNISERSRIVQLTPPGSGCSIVVGEGIVPDVPPGSLRGLQLVVPDIHAARARLQVVGESPTPQPHPLDNVGFVFFSDPDGNGWAVQQISARGVIGASEARRNPVRPLPLSRESNRARLLAISAHPCTSRPLASVPRRTPADAVGVGASPIALCDAEIASPTEGKKRA
jgi:catechol 2,3-dioxygenase-like lactoylglutathione lyase family enzyme